MEKIKNVLDDVFDELVDINQFIYENPELGNEEYKACEAHVGLLRKHGFSVEEKYLGIETAFKATYASEKSGPTIAVMGEYDALPDIGHGCGHNMIGTIADGVGIVLSKLVDDLGGRILVLGTPAEETNGAKVDMADQGVFDDIDIALMAHPSSKTNLEIQSLAMEAIQFEFKGRTAHAAACPEQGINALDAVISTFNSINALREHITSTTRIHGIITEGGVAANIVPEKAVAQFYVRATTKSYLKEVVEKVKNCARGAALATGTDLEITNYEKSYDNFVMNNTLTGVVKKHFDDNGFDVESRAVSMGSLDAGNVSHVCPTAHPMFSISENDIAGHTRELAEATVTPYALDAMKKVILSLAATGTEIINDPNLLEAIKSEHKNSHK